MGNGSKKIFKLKIVEAKKLHKKGMHRSAFWACCEAYYIGAPHLGHYVKLIELMVECSLKMDLTKDEQKVFGIINKHVQHIMNNLQMMEASGYI